MAHVQTPALGHLLVVAAVPAVAVAPAVVAAQVVLAEVRSLVIVAIVVNFNAVVVMVGHAKAHVIMVATEPVAQNVRALAQQLVLVLAKEDVYNHAMIIVAQIVKQHVKAL